jgi:hypothetical protein
VKEAGEWVGVVDHFKCGLERRDDSVLCWDAIDEQRNPRALRFELLGDRVAVLAQKIEDVRAAETEVPAGSAEVQNLTSIGPVVNGLQVDLAKPRDLRSGGDKE